MNKLNIIKSELALPSYNGLTDEECLTALTTENIDTDIGISSHDIRKYLALQGKLMALEASNAGSALMANRYLDLFPTFDMTDSNVKTALDSTLTALIADSLINANDKTAILAMGTKLISRAEELGLGNIRIGYIIEARAV